MAVAALAQLQTQTCTADATARNIPNHSPAQATQVRRKRSDAAKPQHRNRERYIFRSPDGDFTISFPEKPELKQVEQGPVTLVRSYEVTTPNGKAFSVNFQDIGGDPNALENNEWVKNLEERVAAADRAQNIRTVQTHRLAKNIIESELVIISPINGEELNALRRSIIRRARIYTLGCSSAIDKEPVDKPACEKFFASMRFNN
jgi:hypothetical protein